jgi:hypothetical protein
MKAAEDRIEQILVITVLLKINELPAKALQNLSGLD